MRVTQFSPIEEKIEWAERNLDLVKSDGKIKKLIEELEKIADECEKCLAEVGITTLCAGCGNKSCCGRGIEDKFDPVVILINLLVKGEVPKKREIDNGCFFLSEGGCKLRIKEIICINYLCKKIYDTIALKEIIRVQKICGKEMELIFRVCEEIKRKLRDLNDS
jgi:hypothetical protein